MAGPLVETAVDRLYQLPLDQFVAAREQLARASGRGEAGKVRGLAKPSIIAWALNQLYWSSRPTYDRLLEAASKLKAAQADALAGRPGDVRPAGERHRQALREAVRETARILEAGGHPVSSDALRTVTAALEAVPWKERAGRLVRPPAPSGFGVFAGLPVAEAVHQAPRTPPDSAPPLRTMTASRASGGGQEHARRPGGKASVEKEQREQRARGALVEAQAKAAKARTRVEAARERTARAEADEAAARERLESAVGEVKAARLEQRAAERDDFAARAAVKKAERAVRSSYLRPRASER